MSQTTNTTTETSTALAGLLLAAGVASPAVGYVAAVATALPAIVAAGGAAAEALTPLVQNIATMTTGQRGPTEAEWADLRNSIGHHLAEIQLGDDPDAV